MIPQTVTPVKYFCGVLQSDGALYDKCLRLLESIYGPIDYRSQEWPFTVSDYYHPEMGSGIVRQFVSFERLMSPSRLAAVKLETNEIESTLAVESQRKVNLDPGYLDFDKMVLASAKYNGQKIYLDHGIWADLTLHYEKGNFHPYPWSFPDFREGQYNQAFLMIREKYKAGLKKLRRQP